MRFADGLPLQWQANGRVPPDGEEVSIAISLSAALWSVGALGGGDERFAPAPNSGSRNRTWIEDRWRGSIRKRRSCLPVSNQTGLSTRRTGGVAHLRWALRSSGFGRSGNSGKGTLADPSAATKRIPNIAQSSGPVWPRVAAVVPKLTPAVAHMRHLK